MKKKIYTPITDKKSYVKEMFDNIAFRYDFLNHFLSLNIDVYWRKRVISILKNKKPKYILDIATGTADLAILASSLKPLNITGIDISEEMLKIGRKKISRKKLDDIIQLEIADSENIPFNDESFDACMVAFGVRNFENLEKGLNEIYRVLKKEGMIIILEFSKPSYFPIKQIYNLYFKKILPFIGKIISKDNKAYFYLPESVEKFPGKKDFIKLLQNIGINNVVIKPQTFGIATIYYGIK